MHILEKEALYPFSNAFEDYINDHSGFPNDEYYSFEFYPFGIIFDTVIIDITKYTSDISQ